MSILTDGSLAATIAGALGNVLGDVTLSRETEGGYVPGVGTVPGSTETWAAKGMVEDFDSMSLQKAGSYLDGSLVKPGDRKVTLLAHGLATSPQVGDTVTVRGDTYAVLSVSTDLAEATFSLLVR